MHYSLRFEWLGMVFDVSTIIAILVSSLVVLLLCVGLTRNLTTAAPRGGQNVMEWIVDFVTGITKSYIEPKKAAHFVTLALTLFLYIFISNQLGLVFNVNTSHHNDPNTGQQMSQTVVDALTLASDDEAKKQKLEKLNEELNATDPHSHGVVIGWWKSPTATPSVTFALAFVVLLYAHYLGMKKSFGGWLKHTFLNPIHILEEFIIKPLTLPLRLFGNIFAGEVLIAFLLSVGIFGSIPLFLWLGYSVFVGSVQAFIFTTLAMVYISQQVNDQH
ncbi:MULTISPECIES: F0F1 ATP synthase subunit A [Brevibacillus]|jgi:F-type H+-transporting ATPase subunit a|uniref:ATP synthase subunit a n=1 Tax=Brevibacillus borstelensis AK1 TaxID=1300222 RepID=M8E9Z3_9BACL|nr:F0F1 ATP synthase subunit A [Brevibacillus borstelensis]EMT52325.1 ATP synthase subunit A [Brevibacillus borstelensis AK1]KKX54767.1 ATP synthase subunit A [Brevibacillus borstelensis cifa_chp40]MCM3468960.1 F0F1 ATP synthase subunit A [Brevibacillus borstelensis]MCM3624900.1 F0F1 ATP synthase subunit A [Brevibacillus borstelensis]MED1742761.1 F0F1 ATP synthase subunit A [Brevibacillus borstelensis]